YRRSGDALRYASAVVLLEHRRTEVNGREALPGSDARVAMALAAARSRGISILCVRNATRLSTARVSPACLRHFESALKEGLDAAQRLRHPALGLCLSALGCFYHMALVPQHDRALPYLLRSLHLPVANYERVVRLNALARALSALGRYREADVFVEFTL